MTDVIKGEKRGYAKERLSKVVGKAATILISILQAPAYAPYRYLFVVLASQLIIYAGLNRHILVFSGAMGVGGVFIFLASRFWLNLLLGLLVSVHAFISFFPKTKYNPSEFHLAKTREINLEGVVDAIEISGSGRYRLDIRTEALLYTCYARALPWLNVQNLKEGDRILAKVSLRGTGCNLRMATAGARRRESTLATKIQNQLGRSPITALLLGVSLGEQSGFAPKDLEMYKGLGVYHALVLSGMQISLLAWVLQKPLMLICGRLAGRAISSIAILYVAVSLGLGNSFVIALGFMIAGTFALLSGSKAAFVDQLGFSFLALNLYQPLALRLPGVQMSYTAILALYALRRWPLVAVIACNLATAFVVYLWFGIFSIKAVVWGVMLSPLFGVIGSALALVGVALFALFGFDTVLIVAWSYLYWLNALAKLL